MSKHDFDGQNDRDEIYGKGKESRKKRKNFRNKHDHNSARDFKRNYSQESDREDINFKNKYY